MQVRTPQRHGGALELGLYGRILSQAKILIAATVDLVSLGHLTSRQKRRLRRTVHLLVMTCFMARRA